MQLPSAPDKTPSSNPKQALGQLGERIALLELRRKGYDILAQNWRNGRLGEVDLIARQNNTLVFVEVKTRRGQAFGAPEESVQAAKQRKLILAAERYLVTHAIAHTQDLRFDVVAVTLWGKSRPVEINHIEGAFTADG